MSKVLSYPSKRLGAKSAILRIEGGHSLPRLRVLLERKTGRRERLQGLRRAAFSNGRPLSITHITKQAKLSRQTVDEISQLLQDNGFEDASKFLDCVYDL